MPIRSCFGESWVGAAAAIIPPIGPEDCAKYPAFNELVEQEGVAGRGCTVRGGVGYAKRTVEEIAASCVVVVLPPVITLYYQGVLCYFEGLRFGELVEGESKLEYLDGETWVDDTLEVLTWVDEKIELVTDLCAYLEWETFWRVRNGVTGLYSPGFEITLFCGL